MAKQSPTCPTPAWLKPVARFLRPVASALTFLWQWTRNIGLVIKPCRLSLLLVAAGLAFLFISDQGLDTLRDFAERRAAKPRVWNQTLFFLLGGFLWAFGSWYWARLMYYVRLDDSLPKKPWVHWTQTWLPRFIGLSAILGLAWAFYCAAAPYPDTSRGAGRVLMVFALISLIGAVVFLVFTITRRELAKRFTRSLTRYRLTATLGQSLGRVKSAKRQRYGNQNVCEAMRASWPMLVITLGMAVGLFIFFAVSPERFASAVGSTPILLLAAAGWIAFGSAVDLFGMRARFPVFTTMLIFAFIFSFWNDNHAVRVLKNAQTQEWKDRPLLVKALRDWQERQQTRLLPKINDQYPLFIVAAEGGGIRAAYWTATVLGTIQDRYPCFADQLFALSGVSGGSLGSTVFTALLADQHYRSPNFRCGDRDAPQLTRKAQMILGADFLAPAIAATLYPDLVQRFWPFPIPHFDRARALELSWERIWRRHAGNNRFAEPFDKLWNDQKDHWLPALFLNSTWVETGKRLIVSNLRVTADDFSDVEDAQKFYGKDALPLSAAVHLSARFTYVSPAGTLVKDGLVHGRAVDGGYFENSGATTALEILKTISQMRVRPDGVVDPFWSNVEPVLIHISNDPVNPDSVDMQLAAMEKNKSSKPTACCNEIWSPLRTLLATRGARGTYAHETARWHVGTSHFLEFGLCANDGVKLPLGWVLSEVVRSEMFKQLEKQRCDAFDNPGNIKAIESFLAKRTARSAP
jgi:hypothetical protein